MKKITVLHLIYGLKLGGAERVLVRLCTKIDRDRFYPLVGVLTCGGPFEDDLAAGGVDVVRLGKRHALDFTVVPRIVRLIKERDVSIVHTHLFSANMWGRVAARAAGNKIAVVHEQSVDPWKSCFHFAIDRFLLRWTDAVIAVSDAVRGYYQEKLRRANGIFEVIYNGVDFERFAAPAPRGRKKELLGIPSGNLVLGVIGRLVHQKALDIFLPAFARVARLHGEVSCIILGEGPLRGELEELAGRLGCAGRVFFVGPRRDIEEWLADIDVVVSSSRYEGLSLALAEAMAAGKPVIATDVGGNAELVVDGETGFIVPPGDVEALSSAVIKLIGTPGLIDSMGEKGRLRAGENFTEDVMVTRVQALYDRLLAESRR